MYNGGAIIVPSLDTGGISPGRSTLFIFNFVIVILLPPAQDAKLDELGIFVILILLLPFFKNKSPVLSNNTVYPVGADSGSICFEIGILTYSSCGYALVKRNALLFV